uniref:TRUD domain-containing protein n=1 Tax=Daphnia galeata TaxID=27404 RepID=A0A8J2S3E1_9CRUS|nr:unnamed protein product [Daphnia galeata]
MYMEHRDTSSVEAKSVLTEFAKKNKMTSLTFNTADSKHEKRSITCQLVTANKNLDPKKLKCDLKLDCKVAFGNFTLTDKPLQQGSLRGNRYDVALRNVIGDKSQIEENLKSLKENGFINYYGTECFETMTHFIGKQLLLNQWKEAIDLILEEFQGQHQFHSMETQLLCYTEKNGKDLVGALNTIPFEMRLSYIHAYQSDLVYGRNIDGNNTKSTSEMCDDGPQEKMESDSCNSSNQAEDSHPNIVLIDENNIHYYTIDDVVLPLPGYGVIHPANQVVTWYKEILLADGLSEMDFKRSAKNYSLPGEYRQLISKPSDFNWKFVCYNNPTEKLLLSDLDRLERTQSLHTVTEEKPKQSKYLDFCIRLHVSILHFTRFCRWNLFCLLQLIQKTKSTINRCPTQKKRQLSSAIRTLPGKQLGRVVHIFRSLEPKLGGSDPDEAVLDLEKLQPITLRTLEKYVKSCLTMKPSKTYEKNPSDEGKERLEKERFTAVKVNCNENVKDGNCFSETTSEIGLRSSSSPALIDLETGGDFLGLVLEFNLPPSSYASMVITELMKVDNSAVLKKENDHSEHFSQAAIESSDSVQVSRKKQSKMFESSIVRSTKEQVKLSSPQNDVLIKKDKEER